MTTNVVLPISLVALLTPVHRWHPSRPIVGEAAVLFLADQPFERIEATWSVQGREGLRGQTKAAFDDFIENGRPPRGVFAESGGRTGIAQMKVLAPNPGVRLFGGFVQPDCFIGIRLLHRDELPFKPTGQKGVIDYKTLGQDLIKEWAALLPGVSRMRIKDMEP